MPFLLCMLPCSGGKKDKKNFQKQKNLQKEERMNITKGKIGNQSGYINFANAHKLGTFAPKEFMQLATAEKSDVYTQHERYVH